jgi:outer membrane protein assembly factor BamB
MRLEHAKCVTMPVSPRRARPIIAFMALLVLGGCSWFESDKETRVPVNLLSIDSEVSLVNRWSVSIGGDLKDKAVKLVPVVDGARIYAAAADGQVAAVDTVTGEIIWKQSIVELYDKEERAIAFTGDQDAIISGVGLGSDLVLVGSAAGEIIALNQADGTLAWRAKTTSEVLSAPVVSKNLVFAQSIDGKVAAYDAQTGDRKWIYSTSNPSLTVRGTSNLIVEKDFLIAGFANGRVVMLDQERGLVGFEQRVAVARGQSDLERLIDIDGQMLLLGPLLYAVSYQGSLVAIDLSANGRIRWSKDASSLAGLGEGFGNIYVAYEDGRLEAVAADDNHHELWVTGDLLYRDITTPVTVSSYVAVGDFEGYLHLLAQTDGRFVGREKIDGAGLSAPVVADGNRLYIITNSGRLMAFEVR